MDLKETFDKAATDSKSLPQKPDNETLLKLYSLYKQATEGDATTAPTNSFDFVGMAKFNAWENLKGKSKEDAMAAYIVLVEKLKGQ